ncbi:MAG: deoxyribose-phosphate aldolase [Myxococcota bacterium]
MIDRELAAVIDHTLLRPDATAEEVRVLCKEAKTYGFRTVCVHSGRVALAARCLEGSEVSAIAVVGFPHGAEPAAATAFETHEAVRAGAREIDMVLGLGALKDREHARVFERIQTVVRAAGKAAVKVIIETALLEPNERVIACSLAAAAGAAFVKTSTGFAGGGATVEDVALMREVVGPHLGVKASGGIRDAEKARALLAAGATRIGASASVSLVGGGAGAPGVY